MRCAILIPTVGRADKLGGVVANASGPDVTVYLIMEPQEACEIDGAVTLTRPEGFGRYAVAANYGYRQTSEPLLFAGADDLSFHTGWLQAARSRLTDQVRVVGTNDLGNPDVAAGEHSTHYLIDRRYLDDPGGVFDEGPGSFLHQGYDHNYTDTEFVETAKLRGVWVPCLESVVEHLHPAWGKAQLDSTYSKSFLHADADGRRFADRWARCAERSM